VQRSVAPSAHRRSPRIRGPDARIGALWSTSFHLLSQHHVSDIDWNLELRKIVREYDGLPAEHSRTQLRLQKIREIAAKDRFLERVSLIGIWVRLILIAALGVSLFWWPYGRHCGMPLAGYLISNGVVIIGALSLAIRTWRDRLSWAFLCSTLCVCLAWTVIALNVLPRLGYAPVGGTSAAWSCAVSR
jgi:uncharacterized membrane protein